MFSHYLLPTTTRPTRVTENTASLIDHIWTNQAESNTSNYIIHTDISDHFPIISRFRKTSVTEQPVKAVYRRVFSHVGINNFVDSLSQVSWDSVFDSDCPNTAYNWFIQNTTKCFRNIFRKSVGGKQGRLGVRTWHRVCFEALKRNIDWQDWLVNGRWHIRTNTNHIKTI